MYNENIKSPNKIVTFFSFILLIAFIYSMVQLHFITQHDSLSKEVAEVFELVQAPEMNYVGKGSAYTLGNHHFYEVKIDDKNYFIRTDESRYHLVRYIDVTYDKEKVIKDLGIILK
jgi:hypothetical protein